MIVILQPPVTLQVKGQSCEIYWYDGGMHRLNSRDISALMKVCRQLVKMT